MEASTASQAQPKANATAVWRALAGGFAGGAKPGTKEDPGFQAGRALAAVSMFRTALREKTKVIQKGPSKKKVTTTTAVKAPEWVLEDRRSNLKKQAHDSKVKPWILPTKNRSFHREGSGVAALSVDHYTLMVSPTSPFRLGWDFVQLVLLCYIALIVPWRMAFGDAVGPTQAVFDYFIDGVFLADVLLNFRTGYISDDGRLIMKPQMVAQHYLRTWFTIDVVSSVPDFLFMGTGAAKTLKAGRIMKPFRFMRLSRLLRVFRRRELLDRLDDIIAFNQNIVSITKLPLLVAYFSHFYACVWVFVGALEQYEGVSWLDAFAMRDESNSTVYSVSLHWCVSTLSTVGYGDIWAQNNAERAVAVVGMLLGGALFGYTIAVLGAMVAKLNAHNAKLNKKMDAVKGYIDKRSIPRELRSRIRAYFKHFYSKKTAFDERAMFGELSASLRVEIAIHCLDNHILEQPILQNQGPAFLADLFLELKPMRALPGDLVFETAEMATEVYFVTKGEVEILSPDNRSLFIVKAGSSVGEGEVLSRHPAPRRMCTARALTEASFMVLSMEALNDLYDKHPAAVEMMENAALSMYKKLRTFIMKGSQDQSNQELSATSFHRLPSSCTNTSCASSDFDDGPDDGGGGNVAGGKGAGGGAGRGGVGSGSGGSGSRPKRGSHRPSFIHRPGYEPGHPSSSDGEREGKEGPGGNMPRRHFGQSSRFIRSAPPEPCKCAEANKKAMDELLDEMRGLRAAVAASGGPKRRNSVQSVTGMALIEENDDAASVASRPRTVSENRKRSLGSTFEGFLNSMYQSTTSNTHEPDSPSPTADLDAARPSRAPTPSAEPEEFQLPGQNYPSQNYSLSSSNKTTTSNHSSTPTTRGKRTATRSSLSSLSRSQPALSAATGTVQR